MCYLGKQCGLWTNLLFDLSFEELPQWRSPWTSLRQLCRSGGQLHQKPSSETLLRVELAHGVCRVLSLQVLIELGRSQWQDSSAKEHIYHKNTLYPLIF